MAEKGFLGCSLLGKVQALRQKHARLDPTMKYKPSFQSHHFRDVSSMILAMPACTSTFWVPDSGVVTPCTEMTPWPGNPVLGLAL